VKPERTYILHDLATTAERIGLTAIDRIQLAKIQCSAGVRYGTEASTVSQALDAHHAALRLCGIISTHFTARGDWRIR
jgi:hypothetical protein